MAWATVFVFIFFGVVAVVGTFYLQSGNVTGAALIASLPVAMLVTAILVVNNLRDIDTDRQAGKRTLAVRFGREATQLQYSMLVLGAYLVAAAMWLGGANSAWAMLPWLTLPLGLGCYAKCGAVKAARRSIALCGGPPDCIWFSESCSRRASSCENPPADVALLPDSIPADVCDQRRHAGSPRGSDRQARKRQRALWTRRDCAVAREGIGEPCETGSRFSGAAYWRELTIDDIPAANGA